MKILWHSNSPLVSTGYGNQTALFTPLVKHRGGHEVAISSYYGLEGAPIMWEDIPVFAGLGGEFGNQYIAGHASAFFGGSPKGGIVFTLMDVLALSKNVYSGLNTVCWTPVDHDPATPAQKDFFANTAAIPIAMSQYGQEQLEEFDPLYVPHGVDTNIFKPMDKKEIRQKAGVPEDAYIMGMVAANKGFPSRKSFIEVLMAFAMFQKKHEEAILYFHSEITGEVSAGIPIGEVAGSLGIPPDAIARADQYRLLFSPFPTEEMAAIYNTFDILLNPSSGEGFGIPIMEAQACGIPAIVTDFSAMSEVCGVGWKVNGQKVYTGQRSWQLIPNVHEIYMAMEDAYSLDSQEKENLSNAAVKHARDYDHVTVFNNYMKPALEEVEERIGAQPKVEA